jgi:hypothetical protein
MVEGKLLVCMTGDEYAALQTAAAALAGLVGMADGTPVILGGAKRSKAMPAPRQERMCDVCGKSLGPDAPNARKRHAGSCAAEYHRRESKEWLKRNPGYRRGKNARGARDLRKAEPVAVNIAPPDGDGAVETELDRTAAHARIKAALANADRKLGKGVETL